jgi:sugar/nucleoside kinase (ribokinase family)
MASLFRIHGTGFGLADLIHSPSDFESARYVPYRMPGGMAMGTVAFVDDLAERSGRSRSEVIADLEATETAFAAGGPGLVSMVLAAQLLRPVRVPVTYYGLSGDDSAASRIRTVLARTPLDMTCYRQRGGITPVTHVFSDPRAGGGDGDRCFVHAPGVSMDPALLGESFFQATFNVYAGTALMPRVHAELPKLLAKSHRRGALTVAGPVFDAYAEREGRPWNFGEGAWEHLDLLVADEYEAERLSGARGAAAAVDALMSRGLTTAVVTRGAGPVYYRSIGGLFGKCEGEAPADQALTQRARDRSAHPGDTTGAGDNFLGALMAAFMFQILSDDFFPKGEVHLDRELFHMIPLHLRKAVDFAVLAGGLACLQFGGVRLEHVIGERLAEIRALAPEPEPSALPW